MTSFFTNQDWGRVCGDWLPDPYLGLVGVNTKTACRHWVAGNTCLILEKDSFCPWQGMPPEVQHGEPGSL